MKKKSRVYLQMFLSYLGILAIPIVIGMIIYLHALYGARAQADRMNDNMLNMVQREMDSKIGEVQKLAVRLAMDDNVQIASQVKGTFEPKDQFLLYTLYRDLKNINLSEQFIKDVFVYFNHTQTVASIQGNMPAELYYELYYDNENYPLNQFKEYMRQSHYMDTLSFPNRGSQSVLFTMTNLYSSAEEKSATVGIAIDLSELKKTMASMKWDEQVEILVVNSRNEVIARTRESDPLPVLDYNGLEPGNYTEKHMMNEPYVVSVGQSDMIDWKYVIMIPQTVLEKDAREIQQWSLIGLFCCIIAGFWFSYVLTRKNYNPLKGLMELFAGHSQGKLSDGQDEYQWLREQIGEFFREHSDAQQLLADNRKKLKNYHLLRLLEYSCDADEMKNNMEKYQISLKSDFHAVVLFVLRTDSAEGENAFYRFIIQNIFGEKAGTAFGAEVLELGERVAAIVNFADKDEARLEQLKELIDSTQQMITEKFGFQAAALTGGIHRGLEGIHQSYIEANELVEYVNLLDDDLILYGDVRNMQKKYDYSMEMEQKIINAIKTGNAEKAGEYISSVFDRNLKGKISIDVCRCLTFDMMGTLLKGADEGGYHEFAEDVDFSNGLLARLPIQEMKKRFCGMAGQICGHILQMQRETDEDQKFSKRIESYIQENFKDPDLNISITAQNFDITPAYLSSVYKKQTGKSLLDYINTLRIDCAEALLEQGRSVVEAAQQSGFRDSGAFIRAFKKKKGVTPGQLKKKS